MGTGGWGAGVRTTEDAIVTRGTVDGVGVEMGADCGARCWISAVGGEGEDSMLESWYQGGIWACV